MDLHFTSAQPTEAERAAVDSFLGVPTSQWEGAQRSSQDEHISAGGAQARSRRDRLLPTLHAVSSRVGWISEGALNYICRRLTVAPADAYGVASFYGLFAITPRPAVVLHVCDDIVCMSAGAAQLCNELEQTLGPAWRSSAPSVDTHKPTWMRSPCLGLCERAPAALRIEAGARCVEQQIAPLHPHGLLTALEGHPSELVSHTLPQEGEAGLRLLARVGRVNPTKIDDYRASGGFGVLRRALDLGPRAIIGEVLDSKLVGRGGAAFPTGRKWEAVAAEPERPHYLVCNADESEPGTFKDRILMEADPFALIEAMTIAAIAGGCERGFIYIRGEYPLATERVRNAIEQARKHQMLGENIMERGLRFDIELRRGAGAYICGEETALFNSIEGYRGEPRNKPPFPTRKGLYGKPTIVNNVETLANVLPIVRDGGRAYASIGTPDSTGTKLFCVSGHVKNPGLYEVPFGTTLRALIDLAGGVREGSRLQSVLLGGAAGAFVTPEELDIALTFEGVRAARATIGSGVVIVFDDSVDLGAVLLRIAAFFRDESCGQCVPCRIGTVRQEELLHRLAASKLNGTIDTERALLAQIGQVMRDASICGLGQTASSAIESALAKFSLFGDGAHT